MTIITAAIWIVLWVAGGWLLAASLFRPRRGESALVGAGLGLVLQTWFANTLAHFTPTMVSLWLSAVLVFAAGVLGAVRFRRELRLEVSLVQWVVLGALIVLFNAIGRGLGIFDDYQNLPTISLMATGDVPPHFALNPSLSFGYHYLLLLFSAEVMRLLNMYPWSALDLCRAMMLALPLMLAYHWGYRLTHSRLAAFLTSLMLAFAGGSRWLLLLLPPAWLARISANISLIGSAASSAPTLSAALLSPWRIDGAGPIPFPFAFYTGINQPFSMAYTGIAGSGILIMLLLLLMAQRWRHWSAAIITSILLAALAMANEIAFLLIGLGFIAATAAWIISRRKAIVGHGFLMWMAILAAALAAASVQGGMLSDMLSAAAAHRSFASNYFDASPIFVWPPAIISAHLGSLSLVNPAQLVCALAEIGPIILITPLLFAWGWKSLRLGKWYEASLIAASCGMLVASVMSFKGPLFTATPRLMSGWFFACILYSAPLLYLWARQRGDVAKIASISLGLAASLGGLVLFSVQLAAIQKPVYATFITPMDAKMAQLYWNELKPGAWVFDPVVFRAPTVFGRFTHSSPSWYTRSNDWQALNDLPDPLKIRAAGYSYMYFDRDYWDGLTRTQQELFEAPCVEQIAEVEGIHGENDYSKDFRRLLDIEACR